MASALETLCGQAYGAKQNHMLGIYLQRSWIILTATAICLTPLYIFTTPLLRGLSQDENIVHVAQYIVYWTLVIVFSYIPCYTCQMFLQAQSKNKIIAYVAAISLAMHLFLSWVLTFKLGFGFAGAMASTVIAYWLPNIGDFSKLLLIIDGGTSWISHFKDNTKREIREFDSPSHLTDEIKREVGLLNEEKTHTCCERWIQNQDNERYPKQENISLGCGIFVCKYAKYIIQKRYIPKEYGKDMQGKTRVEIFKHFLNV